MRESMCCFLCLRTRLSELVGGAVCERRPKRKVSEPAYKLTVMEWQWWLLFILAFLALGMSLRNRASLSALNQRVQAFATHPYGNGVPVRSGASRDIAVVFNPAKISNMEELRSIVTQSAIDAGYGEPHWFATSKEETGALQTRAALRMHPAVVIAVGGDGTVRAVAGELSGTNIPLGIIPAGTGNLLARNLSIPLNSSLRDLASIAITGRRRRIDIGRIGAPAPSLEEDARIRSLGKDAHPFVGEVPFLVIAGVGFDAAVMSNANENLKANVGWAAYLVSGMKQLRRDKIRAQIFASPDEDTRDTAKEVHDSLEMASLTYNGPFHDEKNDAPASSSNTLEKDRLEVAEEKEKKVISFGSEVIGAQANQASSQIHGTNEEMIEARSILFGNCAKLPAGLVLAPDARIDDGWLDVMIVDTKRGLVGWADLVRRISLQSLGMRKKMLPEVGSIKLKRMRSVHVRISQPELIEADGDTLGYVLEVYARLDPGALIVHVA